MVRLLCGVWTVRVGASTAGTGDAGSRHRAIGRSWASGPGTVGRLGGVPELGVASVETGMDGGPACTRAGCIIELITRIPATRCDALAWNPGKTGRRTA